MECIMALCPAKVKPRRHAKRSEDSFHSCRAALDLLPDGRGSSSPTLRCSLTPARRGSASFLPCSFWTRKPIVRGRPASAMTPTSLAGSDPCLGPTTGSVDPCLQGEGSRGPAPRDSAPGMFSFPPANIELRSGRHDAALVRSSAPALFPLHKHGPRSNSPALPCPDQDPAP